MRRVISAACRGDQCLAVAEGPGPADSHGPGLARGLRPPVPAPGPTDPPTRRRAQKIQGSDQRSDTAAPPAFATTRHRASRQPGCRSVKWAVELIVRIEDGPSRCAGRRWRRPPGGEGRPCTDRVGAGLTEQIQVLGHIRRKPADSGVKGHPQFRPSAKAAHQEEARNRLENPGVADPVGPGLILDGLGGSRWAVMSAVPVEEHEGGRDRGEQVRGGLRAGFAHATEQRETVSVSKLKAAPTAAALARRRLRSARAGLGSAARSSADTAPTASARRRSLSAVSSSRLATSSSGSTAASPRCQARRSG